MLSSIKEKVALREAWRRGNTKHIPNATRLAAQLGFLSERNSRGARKFLQWENEFIIECYYRDVPCVVIAETLNRSLSVIYNQIAKLRDLGELPVSKYKYWTPKEENFLKENLNTLPKEALIKGTGHSYEACLTKARNLKLRKTRHQRGWTKIEDLMLKKGRERGYTFEQIARVMKRSRSSLFSRWRRINK